MHSGTEGCPALISLICKTVILSIFYLAMDVGLDAKLPHISHTLFAGIHKTMYTWLREVDILAGKAG
jgi:hypothetical protein